MSTIFSESFETDGNGTRYFTSTPEFSDGFGDFFTRTDGSNIGEFYAVSGLDGANFFGAMDLDGEGASATQTLELNDIDISGYADLQLSALFAEDDDGENQDWDADTLVYIEVQIDDGGYIKVLQFASQGATNTEPGLDTDFDGIADSTLLTDTFQTFLSDIAGTGTTLDIRVTFENLNAGDEDIALDNIIVTGTAAETTVLDETFDDASSFTTSTEFFSDGGFDFFGITDGAGTGDFGGDAAPSGEKAITGADGNYLAGMDLDGEGASLPITITWSELDIAGLDDLTFSGDFAEFFDDPGDIDADDYIIITASIDGGEPQTILEFRGADFSSGSGDFNGVFREDTDGDGIGDGDALGNAMSAFTAEIEGTGSTLDLAMTVSVNSGDEDFAVDNFKIVGSSGGTVQPAVLVKTDDGISVSEDGATDTFTVELATEPAGPVTITVAAPDGQTEISTDGVTFSATVDVVLSSTTAETLTVRAIDDAVDEATDHTGNLTFTVASDADEAYNGIAVNDVSANVVDNDFTITLIHDIQGSGESSALVGQEATIEGVVVGTLTDSSGAISGYFVQEEDSDADGDANTSEGIYVYDPGATVSVGDQVRVSGEVDEYFDLTQINNVTSTQTLATGVTLPSATLITLAMAEAGFEGVEGMRVELVSGGEDALTVIENFNLDRFGSVVVSEGVQTQATQIFDPNTQQDEIDALTEANATFRLTIDDGSSGQNPDTYQLIDSGDGTPLTAGDPITEDGPTLRLGTEVESITGVMDYSFGEFRLHADDVLDQVEGSNDRPTEAPDVGGDLKVASFNVLNYFTTIDEGSNGTGPDGTLDPRGADTADELARQTEKLVAALVELDADILALQELENNGFDDGSAIATLVAELNAALGAEVYAFVDPGTDFVGTDAITTGIIYKIDAVSVVGSDVLVYEEPSAATTYALVEEIQAITGTDDVGDFQRNRPSVAATFEDADGNEITIVSNHYKSKGDSGLEDLMEAAINAGVDQALIDALAADPNYDQEDGQAFWNQVRADASDELDTWLESNPTGATDTDNVLILGDLNAYAKEDPVQEFVDEGYTDLAAEFIGEGAYSFTFDGQQGTLDYGLASEELMDNITGVAEWHINSDEPDLLNYDDSFNNGAFFNGDEYAASDHDPLIIGVSFDEPTITTRVDVDTNDNGFLSQLITTVGDAVPDAVSFLKLAREVTQDSTGLEFTALLGDGDEPIRLELPQFINTQGDGIGITTLFLDRFGAGSDSRLIDGEEELQVDLGDGRDAVSIMLEFGTIEGDGDITLEFYDDGILKEEVEVEIIDGMISYELDNTDGFNTVQIGVTDSLAVSIDAFEFDRYEPGDIGFG